MIKFWELEKKLPYFERLPEEMNKSSNERSVLPILKLFKKLITEDKGVVRY